MQDFQAIPNLPGRIFPLSLPDLTTTRRLLLLRSNYPHHHQHPQPVKCPRCESTNTKFCYYNNYNLSQPRHFCKSCRRYWTKGGVLRNVPVGGAARKNPTSKPKPKPVSASASSNPNPDPLPEPASASPDPGFGFHFPDPGLLPGFRVAEPGRKEEVDVSGSGSLFDITSSADPAVYWNQTNWGDTDPCSLYLHSI